MKVHHWRYESGEPEAVPEYMYSVYPGKFRDGPPKGWHCWAYVDDNLVFEQWMKINCPTADTCRRFNSGDPMTEVHIKTDEDATLFKLRWM